MWYLLVHVLHTVPVHVPVPYTSTALVTGSGTAGTDTLFGTKNGIKQYRFCNGSVSLLYRVSIAFVLGLYCFCAGSVSLLYGVNVVSVYHNSVVYLLLLYKFTQAHVMYAYLIFIIVDWYKSVFGIRCLLFWNNRTSPFYFKSLCNDNVIKGKCVKWKITEGNCTYTYVNSIMIYWHWFLL